MSYSLLFEEKNNNKRVESVPSRRRDCFLSAFSERDSRRSETRTNVFHPFPPPSDTVLHRAPRSLGSALLWFLWIPWIFSQYHVWYLVKDNSLQFCIAKCYFWFVWHFSREIWHKGMSHDKLEMLLLYPNMIPWPITSSPDYCELFQNSLT